MNTANKPGLVLTLLLAVFAAPSLGQDEFGFDEEPAAEAPPRETRDNHMELGLGYADGNGKLGEFSDDLDSGGFFPVGSLFLTREGESAGSLFYLQGDAGIYGATLEAGYARPGLHRFELEASDSQRVEMGDVFTVVPSSAGSVYNLPEGFSGSADPDSYFRRDLVVNRTGARLSLERHFGDWLANLGVSREERRGDRSSAGSQGFSGTAILVEPVDYSHNEFDLGLDYSTDALAVGVGYYLSNFDNDHRAFTFENPNFPALGHAQLALAPGNEFNRLDLDGRFTLGPTTFLMWMLNWSSAEQDEAFLPYALNTAYYGGAIGPLPGDSLDGEVERFNGRLTLVTRPTPRLDLKAAFSRRDRDADHDPLLLASLSYRGSVTPFGAPSHTYGKERQKLQLEAGYRFPNRSRLRLGWEGETVDRQRRELALAEGNFVDRESEDSTDENRIWADYRLTLLDSLRLTFRLEHAERDADISEERIEHLHFVSRDAQGNLEAVGENTLPYYLAPRDQEIVGIHGSYMLTDTVALDGGFRLVREDFNHDFEGLSERESRIVDLGLSFAPSRDLALSLYGSYETFEWRQEGTTSGGGGAVTSLWTARGEDDSLVLGANMAWTVIPDRFSVEGDLSFSDSDSDLSSHDRLGGSEGALPGYGSEVVRLDVNATWSMSQATDLKLRYIYEDWRVSDFAWYDGEIIDNIAFGWQPYHQDGHGLVLSVRRNF